MFLSYQVEPDSNCFEIGDVPSCQDSTCATQVCENEVYAYCCTTDWDFFCLDAGCNLCQGAGSNDSCNALADPHPITITIQTDLYGSETVWQLTEKTYSGGEIFLADGPYVEGRPDIYTVTETLFPSCFEFLLADSGSDGGAVATIDFMGFTYTLGPDFGSFITALIGDCEY